MNVRQAKQALREQAATRRAEAALAAAPDAAMRAVDAFKDAISVPPGKTVSGYWPLRDEFDPRPLLEYLHQQGHPCCLPVTGAPGTTLTFRHWSPGMALLAERFGTMAPPPEADEIRPDLLLVPLLAFDDSGRRLGYGGGFYDRTLAALRAAGEIVAVGLGFAAQREAEVPADESDARLDWVVTEEGAIHCE